MNHVNIVTNSEFAQLAPEIDLSVYDAPTISGMIGAASRQVENYLEYTPFAEDIVAEVAPGLVDTRGDLIVMPEKIPVVSIASLAITKGTTSIDIGLTNSQGVNRYNIDYTKRNIRFPYSEIVLNGTAIFSNFLSLRTQQFYVSVSYRGGWEVDELPYDIKIATVLFMRDILAAKFNPMGATNLSQGAVSFGFSSGRNSESKLVKDAQRLLAPYKR